MPPNNSPTRHDRDSNQETNTSPRLTTSARLPIIRTNDESPSTPTWRTLMNRAMDQASNTNREWTDLHNLRQDQQVLRNSAQRVLVEGERYSPQTMSTYRGWAPGTTESDRSTRSGSVRQTSRNDHTISDTATRRYRREQQMHELTRMENVQRIRMENAHRIDEERNANTAPWYQTTAPGHVRSRSGPRQTMVMSEPFRSTARAELLRERIQAFAENSNYGQPRERLRSQDNLPPSDGTWPIRHHDYNEDTSRPNRASFLAEQHITRVFEEAIVLLDGLRLCLTQLDRSTLLESAGFGAINQAEMLANENTLDTRSVLKPQPSSLLRPGARFSGEQTTSTGSGMAEILRLTRRARARADEPSSYMRGLTAPATRPRTHGVIVPGFDEGSKDCWPVKVTITSVDYKDMTLTGTMEAFSLPSAKSTNMGLRDPGKKSTTTYLEGEIIDFHKHTLRTTNFKAEAADDANYWRKLEPFKSLDIEQFVDGFTDMEWISDKISKEWIVMRWKEKCFVPPSNKDSGLTISGFYYITLKRSNGKIEGLYHDPNSCPYQRLNLTPDKPTFPLYAVQ